MTVGRDRAAGDMPSADELEQREALGPDDEPVPDEAVAASGVLEAADADVVDQRREVPVDDEDEIRDGT